MTTVAGSPSEFALGSLNDETGWIALFEGTGDVCVAIDGTFTGTITLLLSRQQGATKTRTHTVATYTAAALFALPRTLGMYFNLRMTAYASGQAQIAVGAQVGVAGSPIVLQPQMLTNIPALDTFV